MVNIGSKTNQGKPVVFRETKLPYVLLFTGILIWFYYRGGTAPKVTGNNVPEEKIDNSTSFSASIGEMKISLQPGRRSPLILIGKHKFRLKGEKLAPLGICYYDNLPCQMVNKNQKIWVDNTETSFRLKGEGVVTITVSQ